MLPNSEFQIPFIEQTPEAMTGAINHERLTDTTEIDIAIASMEEYNDGVDQAIIDAEFVRILEANGLGVEIHETRKVAIDMEATSRKQSLVESIFDAIKRAI